MRALLIEPEMPRSEEDRYYFLLGMVHACLEAHLLFSDHPLVTSTVKMLERARNLSWSENNYLLTLKELQRRPFQPPF